MTSRKNKNKRLTKHNAANAVRGPNGTKQIVSALQALAPDAPDSVGEMRANPLDFMPRSRIVRFNPPVFGFPDRLFSKLRYHLLGTITSTSGSVGTQVMRWNSVFDPDQTSTGHQPLYRDTFAGVYDHYSVVSARAQVRLINDTADPFICGCVTDDDTSASTTIDTLCEQSHGLHALLTPQTGSRSTVRFIAAWDCKQVLGIDPYASETYKTAVASNPAEESTFIIWASNVGNNTSGLIVDVEMEYDVLWTELTTPTQS